MSHARELSVVPNQSLGFKNRIINGAMMIDQRNAGASVTPNAGATYTVDRWATAFSQNSKFTVQQNAGSVTPPAGFKKYLGATTAASYSVGVLDYFTFQQSIEGFNVADLDWGTANAQPVTLSFWVRSSLTGTFGGAVNNSNSTRSYPFTYTILVANTWEQKSITISGDTSGTWLTTNGNGLTLNLSMGMGSTYSGTAGAWSSSAFFSATGATSVVGTDGATFYITGVQLEKGSTATSFDYRPYGTELALCQRYYEFGAIGAYYCTKARSGDGVAFFQSPFLVTKRGNPTVAISGATADGGTGVPAVVEQIVNRFTVQGNAGGSGTSIPQFTGWTATAEL